MKRSIKATTLTLESIDLFRSSLSVRGKSEQTMKAYTTDLKILLRELETDSIPMEDFEETGMNWLTANSKKLKAKTTGRRLTSLKGFAIWAGWGEMFSEYNSPTPLKGQPHPIPEGIPGVKRMIAYSTREHHAALVALCGLCGLRCAEALNVRPSHFDMGDNIYLHVFGKGDKERIVPVSADAWEVLCNPVTRAFLENDRFVVGLRDRAARAIITRLAILAGLKRHVASHDLRATFATALYNATLDQRLVQEVLGHASGGTTEVYIEVAARSKKLGVEKMMSEAF